MNIAIIPAKQHSRRFPNKNIKKFFGRPLILWTIDILKKTKLFKKIYVTTNSKLINKILKKKKNIEIIKRPKSLITKQSTTIQVIKHAVKYLKNKKIFPKYVCCMYPAAPNTDYNKVIFAFKIVRKNRNKFIFPALVKSGLKDKKIFLTSIKKIKKNLINDCFYDAGQFYLANTKTWLNSKKIIKNGSKIILLKRNESVDIDTYSDFLKAKKIFKQKHLKPINKSL